MKAFSRRNFLSLMSMTVVSGLGKNIMGQAFRREGAAQNIPNIILIVTDDHGYADYGGYSHVFSDVRTPNMAQLLDSGISFTQGYATSPICSPSRSGLITGRYQQRWGCTNYNSKGLPDDLMTIPRLLKQNGYRTVKIGKTHYGRLNERTHTDEQIVSHPEFPLNHGFDEFFGFIDSTHDYKRISKEDIESMGFHNARTACAGLLIRNQSRESRNGYTTDVFTDEAISQINKSKGDSRPFYIQLSYNALHVPIRQAPQKYLDRYGLKEFPFWNPKEETFLQWHERVCWPKEWNSPELRKYYLAALENLNDNIGRLLDCLKKTGLRDNTFIIFTSDNGGTHNTGSRNVPLSGHKYLLCEGGIRVPFVVSWPKKIQSGQVSEQVVTALDILPTLLDIAGIPLPKGISFDGVSLLTVLAEGNLLPRKRTLFWWRAGEWAVRDGDWKLHVVNQEQNLHGKRKPPLIGTYLFNLKEDVSERHNIADQNSKIGTVKCQRTYQIIIDNHVSRQMPPLVECFSKLIFLVSCPDVFALECQLIVNIHLIPAYFIYPDHRTFRVKIIEFCP